MMGLDQKRLNTIAYKAISDRIKTELSQLDSTKSNASKKSGVDEFGYVSSILSIIIIMIFFSFTHIVKQMKVVHKVHLHHLRIQAMHQIQIH